MSKSVLYPSKKKPNDNPGSFLLFCVVIMFWFSLRYARLPGLNLVFTIITPN